MNQQPRFVDSGYWLALVNEDDASHEEAAALAAVSTGPLLTTEAIVLEVGDALSRPRWRAVAAPFLMELRSDPILTIVPLIPHGSVALWRCMRHARTSLGA